MAVRVSRRGRHSIPLAGRLFVARSSVVGVLIKWASAHQNMVLKNWPMMNLTRKLTHTVTGCPAARVSMVWTSEGPARAKAQRDQAAQDI